jgi:uncharacterized protein YneF (UPF0154 family)
MACPTAAAFLPHMIRGTWLNAKEMSSELDKEKPRLSRSPDELFPVVTQM